MSNHSSVHTIHTYLVEKTCTKAHNTYMHMHTNITDTDTDPHTHIDMHTNITQSHAQTCIYTHAYAYTSLVDLGL